MKEQNNRNFFCTLKKLLIAHIGLLLATVIAVTPAVSLAEDADSERQREFRKVCASTVEMPGKSAQGLCGCLAEIISDDMTDDEYKAFKMGDFGQALNSKQGSAQLAQCGELAGKSKAAKPVAKRALAKSSGETYSYATCPTFAATLYLACKGTITGGHAWCFTGNDWGWDDGDILCTGAPAASSCTSDTVRFGIIPTLLPKGCKFSK